MERRGGRRRDRGVAGVEAGCGDMAGAVDYEAEREGVSMKVGELGVLRAVRAGGDDGVSVAEGTSCRQQIRDGTGRRAMHVARVLECALAHTDVR